ncbi:hypothetical protein Kpho02_61630 [Kitasatospora phosalacinea]|uniref:Uncharacterized protein n=1 Tax=Kitasatospora phosalacinea TaxID=2065 RepID=A0A9W6V674_9ACTN|nr:DUF6228 family protein [Kitasatospora phosalacinea]GLW73865.1 hypothetical protein Kpho02_61630 [Kitasatospora phosalacinea]
MSGEAGGRGVEVRCGRNGAVGVLLNDRQEEDSVVRFAVQLRAPGLAARLTEAVDLAPDVGLAGFLAALAADFRGWEGEREWRNADGDLALRAVFRSGGHVGLAWALRPWRAADGGWRAEATTWLEAGEQLAALAAEVAAFLDGGERG